MYGASPGPRSSCTGPGFAAPANTASAGRATTAATHAKGNPGGSRRDTVPARAPRGLTSLRASAPEPPSSIDDPVRADALLQARPDLAGRLRLAQAGGDEAAHVQAVVRVVVVEHAQPSGGHQVVGHAQAVVDRAQPLLVVDRVHRVE